MALTAVSSVTAGDTAIPHPAADFDNYPFTEESGWEAPSIISATVDIDPDTLNLKSKGKWVTAYIELPDGYDVADIDASTVLLGTVPAVIDTKYDFVTDPNEYITDKDEDGILERMVKFERAAVAAEVAVGEEVALAITGVAAGTPFEGSEQKWSCVYCQSVTSQRSNFIQ